MSSGWSAPSYSQRLQDLINEADKIPAYLPPKDRWEVLRQMTIDHRFTAEEFVIAGRAAGVYPSHEQRLQSQTLAQLRDEYWELGFRSTMDNDGRTRGVDQMEQEELYDKLNAYYTLIPEPDHAA